MTLWRYLRERNRPLDVRVFDRADARLGRQQVHDPRARLYDARTAVRWSPLPTQHVRHQRYSPVFDQGELGMCTCMAALGMLSSGPFWHEQHAADPRRVAADRVRTDGLPSLTGVLGAKPFTEDDGKQLYREETRLDDRVFPGHWEPEDTGSSGDWSMAALRDRGLISGWTHAFRWQDVVRLLAKQPISVGVPWYEAMFEPDRRGYVTLGGQVQGGHQFVVDELIPVPDASGRGQVADYTLGASNSWGTSYGASGRFYMTGPVWRRLLAEGGDVVSGKL